MDYINKKRLTVRKGGNIRLEENFVVRVSGGRRRVLNKNCRQNAG